MPDIDRKLIEWESKLKNNDHVQPNFPSPQPPSTQLPHQGISAMENKNSASSPLDDLLSQVKAEFEQSKPLPPPQSNAKGKSHNGEIQQLISEVKTEFARKRQNYQSQTNNTSSSNSTSTSPPLDDLLTQVRAEFENQPPSKSQSSQFSQQCQQKHSDNQNDEDFFATVQSKFEQKKQTQVTRSYEESVNQVRLEEQKKQRKQKSLIRKAKEWLSNLDPHSEEGIWFEEFAYSYPSKLEAAIDYVEALHEVRY